MLNDSSQKTLLSSLLPTISLLAGSSMILRFFNGFAFTLDKWAAGSFLLGTFRKRDPYPLWHGSLVLTLLQITAAKTMLLLEAFYTALELSFQKSITGNFYNWAIVPLKSSFTRAVLDLILAFIAANLIIRLALKAYAGTTLLILAAGFLGILLLCFHADKLQTTFRGSFLACFLRWFFTLD